MAAAATLFQKAVSRVQDGQVPEDVAQDLLVELKDNEKLWLLDGDTPFWEGPHEMLSKGYNTVPIPAGTIERLGIPGLLFTDGPCGVVMGEATAFPVSMAREQEVGLAIGREMRALGANFFGGVCINLPRHPAWGRAQETYGEDPILLGGFGAALTRGVQRNAMAIAKHYALNSMENARFQVDVRIDDAALHEFSLPHFKRCVNEGVAGIMSSYNSVNREWAGQNEQLLTEILRDSWNFKGIVITDFVWGLRDGPLSLKAGQDVEFPFQQIRSKSLLPALKDSTVSWDLVDRSAKRTLATQLRHYAQRDDVEPAKDVVGCKDHCDLARQVAARSMVLVKNEPIESKPLLPLEASSLRKVVVAGPLANVDNRGDKGSSNVRNAYVVTPYKGIKAALPNATVILENKGDATSTAEAVADADVAILVVGYTFADEGEFIDSTVIQDPTLTALFPIPEKEAELAIAGQLQNSGKKVSIIGSNAVGGDRKSLRLKDHDVKLIKATIAANPRTVVVIVTAGAVLTEEWRLQVPALLFGWYSGQEGGNALADVLLGKIDASGRLLYSIPTSEDRLPYYDFGQRLLDHRNLEPAFLLGYGLSYTKFAISVASVAAGRSNNHLALRVKVSNTGHREGRQVVQVYGKQVKPEIDVVRQLLGFATVDLKPGASEIVQLQASLEPLKKWTTNKLELLSECVLIEIGCHSGDTQAITTIVSLADFMSA